MFRLRIEKLLLAFGLALSLALFHQIIHAENTESLIQGNCLNTLIQADEYYQAGEKERARQLYEQCRDNFLPKNTASSLDIIQRRDQTEILPPIYDPNLLERGKNLWISAQDGIENDIESKIYFNLIALTKVSPEFIPAYLALADFCVKDPEFCQKSAKGEQPKSASEVLERVTAIYPDDPKLLRKKIELMAAEERYLQASIAARQFAILYNQHPDARNFRKLADDYLRTFEGEIRQALISQAVVSSVFNIGSAVLGNDPYRSLRGIDMIVFLAQGESNFGQQAANAYANTARKKGRLIEDPLINGYIQRIARKITPYMGRDFQYEFYVLEDPSINAFALPGGKVFINTGALENADSEAEIAGLLGHEISHAVLSHGFLKVVQANFIGSISNVFGSSRQLSQAQPFINFVAPLVTASYSREAERQADILGARSLVLADYSADGLRDFMLKIKAESGDRRTTYLDTHPAPSERVQYLQQMIVDNGYERYAYLGIKEHQRIKQRLKELKKTEDG